jgi:hypothetical protein
LTQHRPQLVRPSGHLLPGCADDRPPGRHESLVSLAIALEPLAAEVPLAAVGLDSDAPVRPSEVDANRWATVVEHDELVGVRIGDAERPGDRQKRLLVLAPRRRLADVVLGEDSAARAGAGVGRVAVELILDGGEVEHIGDLGLVERALETAPGDDGADVEKGASDRRARDVVDDGDVCGGQRGRAVDRDARVLAPRPLWHGDVDVDATGGQKLVERSGRAVRQGRARAAGEHGGHPQTLALQQLPGHQGVDGVVDAVEAARGGTLLDRPDTQAERGDLIQPEHNVLPHRHVNQGRLEKANSWFVFSSPLRHQGDRVRKRVTGVQRRVAIQRQSKP